MSRQDNRLARSAPSRLPALLTINQVVGPLNVELMTDLAQAGIRCAVVTGWVDAAPGQELPFTILRAKPLVKSPGWKRLWTWGVFSVQSMWHMVRGRRTPMVVVTNPPLPMLFMPLLKRLFGLRYVLLIYDIYPDVVEQMGKLRLGGVVSRLWRRLSRRSLLGAEGVITLGPHMADTLRGHLLAGDTCSVEVIPNWADTDFVRPIAKTENPFAKEQGIAEKFVVMYSGNFGATHDTESIVEAAERLRDLKDVCFVLIGGGTREREVAAMVASKNLPNLRLLPFQPFAVLPYSLTAADCAIVCLDEGYEGVSVPSKTYYALAAGSALLAVGSPGTELADLVAEHRCGEQVMPRRPDLLADAIRRLHGDRELLKRYRTAARSAAEQYFSRREATRHYQDYLIARLACPAEGVKG